MKHIFATIIISAASLSAFADSYTRVAESILTNNPEIAAAKAEAQSELASTAADNNLPDPEIEGEYLFGPGENRWNAGISQGFDWPGLYGARSKVQTARAEAFGYLWKTTEMEKRAEALTALVDYTHACRTLKVLDRELEVLRQAEEVAALAVKHGEITLLDHNKLRIEVAKTEAARQGALLDKAEAVATLTALNGGNAPALTDCDTYPLTTLRSCQNYIDEALANDPTAAYARAQAEVARRQQKTDRMERYPGFSLGYAHAFEEGTHFNGITASISLPFFSWRKKAEASTLSALSSEMQADARTAALTAKITASYNALTSLHAQIEQLGPVFETTDNLTLLTKALKGGQIGMLDFLQEVDYFISAERDYLDLLHRYHTTFAPLTLYAPAN